MKISNIYENTHEYEDKLIKVKGKVTSSVSMFGYSRFTIEDGTGELFVTIEGKVVSVNDVVIVTGTITVPFRFNKTDLLMMKAEKIK